MKIIAYQSAEAPEHLRWMAVHLDPTLRTNKKAGGYLPVRFLGATEEAVRTAAQTFWDEEQARLVEKGIKKTAKAEARAAGKAPATPDESDEAID